MQIKELGGEFALIEKLANIIPSQSKDVLVSIGDDAAVFKSPNMVDQYLLVTTDILIAGEHFTKNWSTPEQIGIKAVECNVSDIAAMGGTPTYMVVSIALPSDTTVEWAEKLYQGLSESCRKHNVVIIGGDTTRGFVETISITLLGSASSKNLCLRSDAKPGDILAVTGPLGASSAGLNLLKNNLPLTPYLKNKFLTPKCRLDASSKLSPIVNAMIDISDGLASEINHLCTQSNVGAFINKKDIPLHRDVLDTAKKLKVDAVDFALNGGEDYELLFSIPPSKLDKLKQTGLKFYQIGKITEHGESCFLISESNKKIPLHGGYKHFK